MGVNTLDVQVDLSLSTVNISTEARQFDDNSGIEDVVLSIQAQEYEYGYPISITLALDPDDALVMIMKLKDALGIE